MYRVSYPADFLNIKARQLFYPCGQDRLDPWLLLEPPPTHIRTSAELQKQVISTKRLSQRKGLSNDRDTRVYSFHLLLETKQEKRKRYRICTRLPRQITEESEGERKVCPQSETSPPVLISDISTIENAQALFEGRKKAKRAGRKEPSE